MCEFSTEHIYILNHLLIYDPSIFFVLFYFFIFTNSSSNTCNQLIFSQFLIMLFRSLFLRININRITFFHSLVVLRVCHRGGRHGNTTLFTTLRNNDLTNQSECKLCASGFFINVTGQSSCQSCPAGTFSCTAVLAFVLFLCFVV